MLGEAIAETPSTQAAKILVLDQGIPGGGTRCESMARFDTTEDAKMIELQPLSKFLAETLREMDTDFLDDLPPVERKEAEETKVGTIQYVRDFIRSLEGFSVRRDTPLGSRPKPVTGLLEYFFDEHYVHDMLKRIPKMVKRAARLSQLFPQIIPFGGNRLVPEGSYTKLHLWFLACFGCTISRRLRTGTEGEGQIKEGLLSR